MICTKFITFVSFDFAHQSYSIIYIYAERQTQLSFRIVKIYLKYSRIANNFF